MENYALGRWVFKLEDGRSFHVKELFFPIHILQGSCLKIYNIKGSRILVMVQFGCFCVKSSRTQMVTVNWTVKSKLEVIALATCTYTCTYTCTCICTYPCIVHMHCVHMLAMEGSPLHRYCIVSASWARTLDHAVIYRVAGVVPIDEHGYPVVLLPPPCSCGTAPRRSARLRFVDERDDEPVRASRP